MTSHELSHMHECSCKAVVGLLHVPCLPIALSQSIPCIDKRGIMLYSLRETLLSFRAVVRENIEGLATQIQILDLWQ